MTSRRTVSSRGSPISVKPATSAHRAVVRPLYLVSTIFSPSASRRVTAQITPGQILG